MTARPPSTVVVLASASPARLSVLRAAGIDPTVIVSGVDEAAVQAANADAEPGDIVAELAYAKASAVVALAAARFADAVVIGCDSMLWSAGTLAGKPADAAAARGQWATMAGGSSELLTGHAVVRLIDGAVTQTARGTESTEIRVGTPDPVELDAYLATREPLAVAGSLTIDGYGGWFVDGVTGDPSSVIGISLPLTRRLLREVGLTVTDLWRPQADSDSTDNESIEHQGEAL
ncbi:MAG: Maf family nucleotide pyrophosphatase [Actinomycetota bacterium]|nr:Maf family nucleotide pyrophosphatase [Actinomycetota bacterium]